MCQGFGANLGEPVSAALLGQPLVRCRISLKLLLVPALCVFKLVFCVRVAQVLMLSSAVTTSHPTRGSHDCNGVCLPAGVVEVRHICGCLVVLSC